MQIDSVTGVISWAPRRSQVASHAVVVQVNDGQGGYDQQAFSVLVSGDSPNRPPLITSIPVAETALDTMRASGEPSYQYDMEATDPDFDTLTFGLLDGPDGLEIDTETGLLTWRPDVDDVGFHDVSVQVSDERGGVASQQYVLRVTAEPGNRAPVIISDPQTDFFIPGFSNPASGQVIPQRINLELSNGGGF